MKTRPYFVLAVLLLFAFLGEARSQHGKRRVNIGFFEGGGYSAHAAFRSAYSDDVRRLLPDPYEMVAVPQGFKSADWDREKCRAMAAELVGDTSVHIIVAIGPWVVEDLLAAGCDRPIIAACRFDPELEGLVDETGRPIADNLAVRVRPRKLENDLTAMTNLLPIKRLGFLYFPSGDETERVLGRMKELGDRLGFGTITAEGYNNIGTYAFFKAYKALGRKVDALYLAPLWGFDATKTAQFFAMTNRDNIPTFCSEGPYQVERGAVFSGSAESIRTAAHFHAWKTVRIVEGETPADLLVGFPEETGLRLNESAARRFGVELPDDVLYAADVVRSAPGVDALRISLHDAIARALQQYPGYLAKYDALEAAAGAARQSYSAYLPKISVSGSVTHVDDNRVHNRFDEIENDSYRASVTLEQTLLSLAAVKSIHRAGQNRKVGEVELREAALDLELAVTIAYLNYLRARDSRQVRYKYRRRVREILQIARAREFLGEGNQTDVLRWRDESLKAARSLIGADVDLDMMRVLLNVLLNQPGNTELVLEEEGFSERHLVSEYMQLQRHLATRSAQLSSQDFLVREAIRANPALGALDLGLEIQRTELSQNRARYYPTVGFQASLHFADELAETATFEERKSSWSVSTKFELPLFVGGDRIMEREKLRASLSSLENEKDKAVVEVMGRVRTAMFRMVGQSAMLTTAGQSGELARMHADMVFDDYSAGECSATDLVEAVRNDLEAALTAVAVRHDYLESAAQVVREVGWSAHEHNRTAGMELLSRLAGRSDITD